MIRFVFGRPGTGKTYTTVERIRTLVAAGERHVYLIVPEQQAYSAERDILSTLPPDAGKCFSILSFSRLCDTLADRFGGRTQHHLSRAMRTLFMWQNLRELSGMPEVYRLSTVDDTLCRKMLSTVEELTFNGVDPSRLEAAAERLALDAPLRGKLRDIALIGAAYNGLVREVLGENPADRLIRAAEQIDAHGFFKGAVVFVDSFTSFTAQEYAVLRSIFGQAKEVTVTIGCGGRWEMEPQFESMRYTVRHLTRLCEDAGQKCEDIVLDTDHRRLPTELSLLEKHLWSYEPLPEEALPPEEERGRVRLVVAPTMYDEAEAAALRILELHDAGIPYGEIALVVRDAAMWAGVLDAALEKYGIPFFLSERTDLNEKPAARLLLTALRAVARHWQAEDLVALCKTGLCGVTPRETDYFAQYTDTWRLSGKRMQDVAWSMNPDGYTVEWSPRGKVILEAANHVREVIMTPLLKLTEGIRLAENVTDQCRALFAYLGDLDIKEQLVDAAEEHLRLEQVREAGELTRLWAFLTETLATVASVMESSEPLSAEELGCALSLVFGETDIGSVPMRHDCVTIGSAGTLRVDNIRAMLVPGLCEGEFPQSVREDGLLSEQDKEALESLGIELDSREVRRMSEELLYVWRTFSKPGEHLYLSYSTSTPDGQVRAPSVAVSRVRDIFPYLTPTRFASRMMSDGNAFRHRTPMDDRVPRPTIRKLLGEEIWLSQSKLSTYAGCPYSYYGAHMLGLRERVDAKLNNLGAGNFLHHVLEQYLRRALDEENRLRPMEHAEVILLADAIIESYIRDVTRGDARDGRLLHLFDRLRQVALVLIDSIQAELSSGDFAVAGMEWDTHGYHSGDPRPMELSLGEESISFAESFLRTNYPEGRTPTADAGEGGMPLSRPVQNMTPTGVVGLPIFTPPEESPIRLLLGGRVDRVDLLRAADGETVYVRVVDYKSSRHDFTVASVSEGMNIQLLLYLFTLCSPENRTLFADRDGKVPTRVLPAGAVYLSPDETDKSGVIRALRTGVTVDEREVVEAVSHDPDTVYLPSMRRDARSGQLVGKGLLSSAAMADLQGILNTTILDTAAVMYAGCAGRTPSEKACAYCRVREGCSMAIKSK